MKIYFAHVIFAILILSGCVNQRKAIQSWMGHDKKELYLADGPPTKIVSDGGDGEILIWQSVHYNYYPSMQQYYIFKMWYANSAGKLYYYREEHSPAPVEQVDLRVYYPRGY